MCEYKGLTTKHAQNIYVSPHTPISESGVSSLLTAPRFSELMVQVVYKLSTKEHFRKPVVVSIVFFGLFLFAGIVKRIDLNIHKKRKTA